MLLTDDIDDDDQLMATWMIVFTSAVTVLSI